jgi:hypothetical protein
LHSFFAFLEDAGRGRVQYIGPLDVRDYLYAAKATDGPGRKARDRIEHFLRAATRMAGGRPWDGTTKSHENSRSRYKSLPRPIFSAPCTDHQKDAGASSFARKRSAGQCLSDTL